MSKLAVVVIHFGPLSITKECLVKLRSKLGNNHLILVNNTPTDIGPLTKLIPGTKLIDNRTNVGFARAVNQGITLALGDPSVSHIFLMNNDLYFSNGGFAQLLQTFATHSRTAIVAPVLHHAGGFDWGGKYSPLTGLVKHQNWENKPKTVLTVDHVAGAAMLIPRTVIKQLGLFDERFFLYYEDLDYCRRVQDAGFVIHINPQVTAEHRISASSGAFSRTLHQWRSHFLFTLKYFPHHAYPTALLVDLIFYPLIAIKSLFPR